MTNQERFVQEDYTSEIPIVKESVLKWYEFPTRPVSRVLEVQQTILERDDNLFISLSGITGEEDTFFTIAEKE